MSAYRKAVQDGYGRQLAEEEKAVKKDLSKDLEEINKETTAGYGGVGFESENDKEDVEDNIDEQIGIDDEDGFNDLVDDPNSASIED